MCVWGGGGGGGGEFKNFLMVGKELWSTYMYMWIYLPVFLLPLTHSLTHSPTPTHTHNHNTGLQEVKPSTLRSEIKELTEDNDSKRW